MPSVMTYTSLVADLEAYLDRADSTVVTQIPKFIALAEQRIAREVKVQGLQQYVTSSFTANNGVYEGAGVVRKPGRWRETIFWNFGSGTGNNTRNSLLLRTYDFCREYWPDPTSTGTPQYYCDYGFDHWLVVPTPSTTSPFEIAYWELPEPLDTNNQANWLTENAPDLLLYACLLEAAPFLKNDERLPLWEKMYQRSAQALGGEDTSRMSDSASNAKG